MSKYTNFYSGSDVAIYLSKQRVIQLDKARGIAYREHFNAGPMFTIGNEIYGFSNRGNLVVNGVFSVNFTDPSYIKKAIDFIHLNSENKITLQNDFSKLSTDQLLDLKAELSNKPNSGNSINALRSGFDIMINFNNGDLVTKSENKIITIQDVRIISAEMEVTASGEAIGIEYGFLARKIK